MNSTEGHVHYCLARTRGEQIARDSVSPEAIARREARAAARRRSRRRARGWWRR